jgi:hypothetical protein
MAVELDHLFICTSVCAPETERLTAFGLTEGAPNTHPGQGTACRRFFFRNTYLELLWVSDPAEAQSKAVRLTHLWERWTNRNGGACPFGLCFRPAPREAGGLPFSTWEYRPPYLPGSLSLGVGTNAAVLAEPGLFYLSFTQRPDSRSAAQRQPTEHASGLGEITRVELSTPFANSLSQEVQAIIDARLLQLRAGPGYLLQLGFDREEQGQSEDFRPTLPLLLRW